VANGEVDRILGSTPRERWPELVENPQLRTCGAIERLGAIFADTVTNDPRKAQAIAELGVSLCENLPQGLYLEPTLAQIRAFTWKDLATALRFLGHSKEAIEILNTAHAHLTRFGELAYDRAIVRFSLAVTLQDVERFAESRDLLAECKGVFRDHRDDRRFTLCVFAEGGLLQRMKRFREAREAYLLLLASARTIEKETLAVLHRGIAMCSIELGDFPEAETSLGHSITLHRELGQRMEVLKGEALLGRLHVRRGDLELAVTHLRPIRREFLRNGLTEEAGICGLEVVQAFLLLDRSSQAETLARRIVGEFTAAGLNTRAISALGYLAEAIAARKVSETLVADVREYIVSLRTSPERDFTSR